MLNWDFTVQNDIVTFLIKNPDKRIAISALPDKMSPPNGETLVKIFCPEGFKVHAVKRLQN